MKKEDIKDGQIYKYIYPDFDFAIFRAKINSKYCTAIEPWYVGEQYFTNYNINFDKSELESTYPATEQEIIWFEYCELHGKYFDKETALREFETRLLKEFIQEYLTE